jgi:hypothetical protein
MAHKLARGLVGLAGLFFVIALVVANYGPIMDLPAEAFSRASSNLCLLALCLFVGWKAEGPAA